MEVSQLAFAAFCGASFAAGVVICVFYYAFAFLPAACGRVYSKKIYFAAANIKHLRPFTVKPAAKKIILHGALFLHDFLSALGAGVLLTLVIYRFNDGMFRIAAPICFFAGFFLCRAAFSRLLSPISEICGFFLRWLVLSLCFIALLPLRWLKKAVGFAFERIAASEKKRRLKKFDIAEKQRLLAAASLNGCLDTRGRLNKREVLKNGKNKVKYDNSLGDRGNTSPLGDRQRDQYNAVQSENERGQKARSGKRDPRGKDRGNEIPPRFSA